MQVAVSNTTRDMMPPITVVASLTRFPLRHDPEGCCSNILEVDAKEDCNEL